MVKLTVISGYKRNNRIHTADLGFQPEPKTDYRPTSPARFSLGRSVHSAYNYTPAHLNKILKKGLFGGETWAPTLYSPQYELGRTPQGQPKPTSPQACFLHESGKQGKKIDLEIIH